VKKKNSQIHIFLETDLIKLLDKEADDKNISRSELIRQKLRESSQLTKIEIMLENLLKRGADFPLPKAGKSAIRK